MFISRFLLVVGLISTCLSFIGCGGGGGGSSTDASSTSSFTYSFSSTSVPGNGSGTWPDVKVDAPIAKTLSFSWSAVTGATYYKLMKNQGGNSGFVQVGGNITETTTTEEISVHLQDWINTRYIVQACDINDVCEDSNNTYSATEMIKSIGLIRAPNGDTNDQFGWSVALSGDGQTLAVGAPAEDSNAKGVNGDQTNNTSTDSGAVYVFVKNNGLWEQQAYLKASNTEQANVNQERFLPNDRFGYRIVLSDDGNTLAVSAILEDSPSWGINCNQDNLEVTQIYSPNSSSTDASSSIASDTSSSLNTGDVYIFARPFNVGAVYVFKRSDQIWNQEAYIKPRFSLLHINYGVTLGFGETLAISGDGKTLAVGTTNDTLYFYAPDNIVQFNNSSEFACLDYNSVPVSSSSNSSSTSRSSSSSSSISSNSSSSAPTLGGPLSGAVYTFVLTDTGWQTEAHIKADNANGQYNDGVDGGDLFAASIALSQDGNTLAVGATGEDGVINNNQNNCYYLDKGVVVYDLNCEKALLGSIRLNNGAAYVFSRSAGQWAQDAYLKPATNFPAAKFGSAIDISNDGNTLAIGATGDGSTITGVVNMPTIEDKNVLTQVSSGAAYVFTKTANTWLQQAYIKPSVSIPTYEFGNEIKLSGDGNILAVGTYLESSNSIGVDGNPGDTSAIGSGAMYIFKRDSTQWSQAAYLKASDTAIQDRFGAHAALSDDGKTLVVGAHRKAGEASTNSSAAQVEGGVYIY